MKYRPHPGQISEVLAAAIRRCAAGEDVVDPNLAARALRAGPCPLSANDREILAACASGLTTSEIAKRVWLSEGTSVTVFRKYWAS